LDEFTLGVSATVPQHSWPFHPHVDVIETDTEVIVTAEVPGMSEDDIELTTYHDRLYIAGEKVVEQEPHAIGYRHIERPHGRFDRTILLPEAIDSEKAHATCNNGILRVVLQKAVSQAHVAE